MSKEKFIDVSQDQSHPDALSPIDFALVDRLDQKAQARGSEVDERPGYSMIVRLRAISNR